MQRKSVFEEIQSRIRYTSNLEYMKLQPVEKLIAERYKFEDERKTKEKLKEFNDFREKERREKESSVEETKKPEFEQEELKRA